MMSSWYENIAKWAGKAIDYTSDAYYDTKGDTKKNTLGKILSAGKTIYDVLPQEIVDELEKKTQQNLTELAKKTGLVPGGFVEIAGQKIDVSKLNFGDNDDFQSAIALLLKSAGTPEDDAKEIIAQNSSVIPGVSNNVLFIGVAGILVFILLRK